MSTLRADPYAVLGVQRGASAAELKAAYRRQALQHHPDRNPADLKGRSEQRFKDISAAFRQLSDESPSDSQHGVARPMSKEEAERLFWSLFGVNGRAIGGLFGKKGGGLLPGRRTTWTQYAKAVDDLESDRLLQGYEARALYRATLRELRGVECDTAASVREAARLQITEHSFEACPERLRNLLIDGRHSLDQLRSSLGVAVIKPAWALKHQQAQLERAEEEEEQQQQQQNGLEARAVNVLPCRLSFEEQEQKERAWAAFVDSRLKPFFDAIEDGPVECTPRLTSPLHSESTRRVRC